MTQRVVLVIPSLERAGAPKQLCLLAANLPRDAFDVHVLCLTHGGPLEAELRQAGIPVKVLSKRWKFDPSAWMRLRRELSGLKPALVHTWRFEGNTYGRSAARSAGVRRIVASERCIDRRKAGYEFAVDRYLARSTDRIVVNSAGVRDFYTRGNLPVEKFTVIPSGVAPERASSVSRSQLLAELALPAGTRLAGAIGRLERHKNVKDLLWGCDQINVVRGGDVHLLILGDGPQRTNLERYASLYRIRENVHFLGERGDVDRFLPHFDLLWSAGESEGQSNSILEAMAAGVPVVARDTPGNRELVAHEATGYLVPPNMRSGYARYADWILSDPALATRLGEAGQKRSMQFSVEAMVARHAELYRELLGGSSPR